MADDRHVVNVNAQKDAISRNPNVAGRTSALTKDVLYAQALARLGFPNMKVEAKSDQLDIFLGLTIDEYNRYLPIEKFDVLDGVTSTINKYDLEKLGKPFGRGVVHVSIGTKENFFAPISGVFALGIPHPISHLSPDQYDLALRYIKTAKKVYSSQPDWDWQEPILWLYSPTGFGGPFRCAYVYHAEVTKPEDVPAQDKKWFQDYFYNMVMKAVGEARSKLPTLPGPNAQTMNGESLVRRADEGLAKLTEDIQMRSHARVAPLGPGGMMG